MINTDRLIDRSIDHGDAQCSLLAIHSHSLSLSCDYRAYTQSVITDHRRHHDIDIGFEQ
jgi:hypothetical protein